MCPEARTTGAFTLARKAVLSNLRLRESGCVTTSAIVDELSRTGVVKLEGVFDASDAAQMQRVVWREMRTRHGIERDDPSTWNRHLPTGLKSTKRSAVFAPICGPALRDALDALLGAGGWEPPRHYGNVLVTMPSPEEWRVPDRIWHSDFPPTLRHDALDVVKIWALFDDVEPGGGGTPQLAGSHILFAQYLAASGELDYKRAKFGFLRSHPWLRALANDDGSADRNERFMNATEIDGVDLQVIECSGRAGDVYVTHPWVFHSIAANARSHPRLMRSAAVWRTDKQAS